MRSSVVVEPASGAGYHGTTKVAQAHTAIPGGSYQVVKGDTLYSIAFRNGVDFRDLAQWNAVAAPYTIHPGQRLKLSPGGAAIAAVAPASIAASTHVSPPSVSAPSAPVFEPVVPTSTASSASSAPAPAPAASSSGKTGAAVAAVTASSTLAAAKPASPAPATTTTVVPVAGVPITPPAVLPPPAPAQAVAATGPSRDVSGVNWRWPAKGNLVKRFQKGDAIPGIEITGNAGDPVRAAADGVVVYSGNGLVGYGELVIIKHSDSFLSAYGHNRKRLVKEGQRVTAGQQVAEMGSTGATRNELEFQIRKDGNPVDPLEYLPAH
jgi:lipoprotein NlpD